MKLKIITYILEFIMLSMVLYASSFDTGFITHKQPDGTEFIARYWGDEYIWHMETENGYRIATGNGGWYYYAKLDTQGEYIPSDNKVAIDKPLESSLYLERSKERISQILDNRKMISEELSILYNENKTTVTLEGGFLFKKVGIILVDFPDSERYDYRKKVYEDMIFSTDYWIGENHHPEGDQIFGSVNDYYLDQTEGLYHLVGKNDSTLIINQPSANPLYPEWMITDSAKSYYANKGYTTFHNLILAEAKENYGEAEIDSYDCIVIIYAGVDMGQNWKAFGASGFVTISERDQGKFRHIGGLAHELGHALFGFHDEYRGDPDINPRKYCLMADGNWNGPNAGSCPSPISPGYKIDCKWVTPIVIDKGTYNQTIVFGDFYKVETDSSTEYFILERFYHTGWYRYISTEEINTRTAS